MKPLQCFSLFVSLLFINTQSYAVVTPVEATPAAIAIPNMSKANMEAALGRKVKINEWFAFKLMNKKSRKKNKINEPFDEGSGFAVAGLVLGVMGLATFNLLFALLGIVFSITALIEMRKSGNVNYRGMARWGLITGIIGLVLVAGIVTLVVAAAL